VLRVHRRARHERCHPSDRPSSVDEVGSWTARVSTARYDTPQADGSLITMPTIASLRYEQHPFSFANVPTSGEQATAVFVIRGHDGKPPTNSRDRAGP
jgi:hypothetical protein